jgi:filamentous hemagglutinin family protein
MSTPSHRLPRRHRLTPLVAALAALLPLTCLAAGPVVPPPPVNAVPVPGATWRTYGTGNTAGPINIANRAGGVDQTINQTSQKAIYNWQSFDIGATSSVTFDMALPGASALNRVLGSTAPSQIFGRLVATNSGEIYLINANGILFGRTAVVNTGSLIASTLNVSDDNFKASLLPAITSQSTTNADAVAFQYDGLATNFVDSKNYIQVAPGATITTPSGGRVFLFAKNVQNAGTITTPDGQTVLAAGSQIYLRLPSGNDLYASEIDPQLPVLRGLLVEVGDLYNGNTTVPADAHTGTVTNLAGGAISVPRGSATLVGMAVNQMGRVSATTSVAENGTIFLRAQGNAGVKTEGNSVLVEPSSAGALTIGPGSVTEILPDPTPAGSTPQTSTDNAGFVSSRIDMLGKTVELQSGASVVAPGATVNLRAEDNPSASYPFRLNLPPDPDARIVLDPAARIDVAGTTDATASVDRYFITTDLLTSNDLADAPLQKDGLLYRSRVMIDVREGSQILGDLSRYNSTIARTVDERLSTGGTVNMVAAGAVLLAPGSSVDVSGGQIQLAPAMVNQTQLVSSTGAMYTVNDAPADQVYLYGINFAKAGQTQYDRWGAIPTPGLTTPAYLEPGYIQGQDAGTLLLDAPTVVMQGTLAAHTVTGDRQRMGLDPAAAPGRLLIGDATGFDKFDGAPVNGQPTLLTDFRVDAQGPMLAPGAWQNPLGATLTASGMALSTFEDAGFGNTTISAQGDVTFDAGAQLALADHGTLTLESAAGNVGFTGHLTAHDGALTMTAEMGHAGLGAGAQVDLSGRWVNVLAAGDGLPQDTSSIGGGSFVAQGERGVTLAPGSLVDVSGGATVTSAGALVGGEAGSIALLAGRTDSTNDSLPPDQRLLQMGGTLRGDALQGSTGGALSLRAPSVRIGDDAADAPPAALHLDPAFFTQGGFSSYAIDGLDFIDVSSGTTLAPTRQGWYVTSADFRTAPSGSAIRDVLTYGTSPLAAPAIVNLSLASSGVASTAINNPQVGGSTSIDAGSQVELVPGSAFKATGAVKVRVDGSIVDHGGAVTLSTPATGSFDDPSYVWLGSTATIDVSGTTVVTPSTDGLVHGRVQDGGSVTIAAAGAKGNYELGTTIVLQEGSRIDLDGTVGTVAVTERSLGGTVMVPETFASHGGSLAITGNSDLALEGTVSANGGNAQAAGGSIAITVLGASDDLSDNPARPPATVPPLRIVDGLTHDTAGLTPDALPTPGQIAAANHGGAANAQVSAQWIRDSGAADLTLQAPRQLYVAGDVDLRMPRNLTLDAQALVVDNGHDVVLGGTNSIVGNTRPYHDPNFNGSVPPLTALEGTGSLTIQGADLVVDGNLVTQGVGTLTLKADHDLQLRSTLDPVAGAATLATAGDVVLQAGQVYPATGQQFTISAPDHRVSISGGDTQAPKPLSAGGALTIEATDIVQDGVVRAPFGAITLDATNSLELGANGETSVSGNGLVVSYGHTTNGAQSWFAPVGPEIPVAVTALPGKTLALNAASVVTDAGAKVDLSGGGTVVAYEFVPGPGGSTDIFAGGNGSYAIVPGMHGLAPFDPTLAAGAAPTGQQIVIGTGTPVPPGTYTLLPARYALLPGAFLVSPAAGAPLHEGTVITNPDGSVLVGARTASANTSFESTASTTWRIQTSAQAQKYSDVLATSADTYFSAYALGKDLAVPRGAADGGVLQVTAASADIAGQFDFRGALDATGHPTGLGGIAAFSADHIVVGTDSTPHAAGTLTLSASQLDAMAPSTLLLGATVGTAGTQGTTLNVVAQDVTFENAGSALHGDDIIAAATGSVSVGQGAALVANAPSATAAAPAHFEVSGDGASVRLSSATDAELTRSGASGASGALAIGPGASLDAGAGSLLLDGTASNQVASGATLHAAAITLAANGVQVGNGAKGGALVLDDTLLGQVNNASHLTLRGYDGIAFLGGSQVGGNALVSVTLDTPTLLAADGSASVAAGEIALANSSGAPQNLPPPGTGTLTLHADANQGSGRILLEDGKVAVAGTQALVLDADRALVLGGHSGLGTGGDITIQAPLVMAQKPVSGATSVADATFLTSGTVRFVGGGTADTAAPAAGAALTVTAASIEQGTAIALPSGNVSFTATSGNMDFAPGGSTSVAGLTRNIDGTPVSTGGGAVSATASAGGVNVAAGAAIDVSAAGDAAGGSLALSAPQGAVALAGTLTGTATSAAAHGAELTIDAQQIPALAQVAAIQQQTPGNFAGALDVRQRGAGTMALDAATTLAASSVALENDGGAIMIAGRIDASGDQGGRIEVAARDDLTLAPGSTLSVHASGATARGGTIELTTSAGTLALQSGATLDLGADASAANPDVLGGRLTLRAPRLGIDGTNPGGTDVAIATIGARVLGASTADVQAVQVYDGYSLITNDTTNVDPGTLQIDSLNANDVAFLSGGGSRADAIAQRLAGSDAGLLSMLRIHPESEIRSSGTLAVATNSKAQGAGGTDDWTLPDYSVLDTTSRNTGDASVTLLAAGEIRIPRTISSGFAPVRYGSDERLASPDSVHAGEIRIVAGADMGATDAMRTGTSTADLSIWRTDQNPRANEAYNIVAIRSTTGNVSLAAGGDIDMQHTGSRVVVYTTGRDVTDDEAAAIRQAVLTSPAGAYGFEVGAGDVSMQAGGSILASDIWRDRSSSLAISQEYASVRSPIEEFKTTAVPPDTPLQGDAWYVGTANVQNGFFSLGGGNITLAAGRNVVNVEAMAPTSGYVLRDASGAATKTRIFAGGDVSIRAGNDIQNGAFESGGAMLDVQAGRDIAWHSGASAAMYEPGPRFVTENGRIDATARRDLTFAYVQDGFTSQDQILTTLGADAVANVQAAGGDAWMSMRPEFDAAESVNSGQARTNVFVPARTSVTAPWGDLTIGDPTAPYNDVGLAQAPVTFSRLDLLAGNALSYLDNSVTLTVTNSFDPAKGPQFVDQLDNPDLIPTAPLDESDRTPVHIATADGDVTMSNLYSARPVRIAAGEDVTFLGEMQVMHQVVRTVDGDVVGEVSSVQAGRDITLVNDARLVNSPGPLDIGGPGQFIVLAGRNVNLGSGGTSDFIQDASGIYASGNNRNGLLPNASANVTIVAGLRADGTDYQQAARIGFAVLGATGLTDHAGDLYAQLLAASKAGGATVVPLGSADAQSFQSLGASDQLAKVQALVGTDFYNAQLANYVRSQPGQAQLSDAQAIAAFANLSASRQAAAAGVILAQSFAGQSAPVRDGLVAEIAAASTSAYPAALVNYMQRQTGQTYTLAEAITAFQALPLVQQIPLLDTVLVAEVRADGRIAAGASGSAQQDAYDRGYRTIATLFPVDRPEGNIELPEATVRTLQGSSITLLTPGGGVDAGGLGASAISPNHLGVVTVAGGDISSIVRDDFLVNQSRVFSLAQGDLMIWSSEGNIDAGRGAKTVVGSPPPVLRFDPNTGRLFLDTSGSFTGSGIAVLDPDSTLDLYAPAGAINAGEAGIKSAGNAFFAAQTFIGTDNLSVGGKSVGAPPPVQGGATAALASAGNSALAGASAIAEDQKEERRKRRMRRNLLIEFLGFGPPNS